MTTYQVEPIQEKDGQLVCMSHEIERFDEYGPAVARAKTLLGLGHYTSVRLLKIEELPVPTNKFDPGD